MTIFKISDNRKRFKWNSQVARWFGNYRKKKKELIHSDDFHSLILLLFPISPGWFPTHRLPPWRFSFPSLWWLSICLTHNHMHIAHFLKRYKNILHLLSYIFRILPKLFLVSFKHVCNSETSDSTFKASSSGLPYPYGWQECVYLPPTYVTMHFVYREFLSLV